MERNVCLRRPGRRLRSGKGVDLVGKEICPTRRVKIDASG